MMTSSRNETAPQVLEHHEAEKQNTSDDHNHTPLDDLFPETFRAPGGRAAPLVTGQCAQVLELIRQHQPLLSFVLTADNALPETAARIHDLRNLGYNVLTEIHSQVMFRGKIRRKAATYSLGVPEWPAPGFLDQRRSS